MKKAPIIKECYLGLTIVCAAMFMTNCSSTYNEYYEEIKLPETNIINGEGEATFTDEIIPTLSDPRYEIHATKGTGPFEPYSIDTKHWLNAPFHTFAFLTDNSRNHSVNYAASDEAHRLLWNVPYFMDDAQGGGHFYKNFAKIGDEVTPRYYNSHKDYRYKFFMVHADDAELTSLSASAKKVTCHVALDGRQDLMHAFAYHEKSQYDEAIRQLPADGTTSLFLKGSLPAGSPVENEYLYSGMSGNRGIHPIFNMYHLLTRLRIRVQGVELENVDEIDYYFNLIDRVLIKAPSGATLVVADDSWERDAYKAEVAAGNLLTADGTKKDYVSEVEHRPMSESGVINEVDFTLLDEEYNTLEVDGEKIYDGETPYHHVKSTESEYLSWDILVPPMPSYTLVWSGRYLFTHKSSIDGKTHLGRKSDLDPLTADISDYYRPTSSTYELNMQDDEGNPIVFEPGKAYTVNLFVYGNSEIKMQIAETRWEDGGTIERGKDEEFTGEGYE